MLRGITLMMLMTAAAGARAERDVCGVATHYCAARIWSLLGDCARWPTYFMHVRECRAIDPEHYFVRVEIGGFRHGVTCKPEGEVGRRLRFSRVGGDMAALEGEWLLEPLGPDRTLVTYTLAADPGWWAPGGAVRGRLRLVLVDVIRGLERWAREGAQAKR